MGAERPEIPTPRERFDTSKGEYIRFRGINPSFNFAFQISVDEVSTSLPTFLNAKLYIHICDNKSYDLVINIRLYFNKIFHRPRAQMNTHIQNVFIYLFIYCHLYSGFSIVQCSNALYRL